MDWLDLVYFSLGALLFFGSRFCGRKGWNEEYTSRKQTGMLRGAAALGVVLHHVAQKTCGSWHPRTVIVHGLDFFLDGAFIFVGIFFFCSGLGLYKSLKEKPDYLRGFLRKRVLPLIFTYYLSEWLYLVIRLLMGQIMGPGEVWFYLSGLHMANENAWFIVTLPLFYFFFYLAFRFIRREGAAIAATTCGVILYMVGCAMVDHQQTWWLRGEWWYNSVLLFPLGLVFAKYEKAFTDFFKKGTWIWLAVSILAAVGLSMLSGLTVNEWAGYYGEYAGDRLKVVHRLMSALSENLYAAAVLWALLLFLMKVRFGNGVLGWYGRMSLEVYLMHGLFIELFGYSFYDRARSLLYIRDVPLFLCVVLIGGTVGAIAFRFLRTKLTALLRISGGKGPSTKGKKRRIQAETGEAEIKPVPAEDAETKQETGTEKKDPAPKAAPGPEKKTRRKKKREAGPWKKRVSWIISGALVLFVGLIFCFPDLISGGRSREINGLIVHVPEGFERSFSDGQLFKWTYTGKDRNPGPLVINTEIKGSNAQYFNTVEEVLADCDWMEDPEIYVTPAGIRTVRGNSMDYSGGREYRYYAETPKNVMLISMNENEAYYTPADCRAALLETVDALAGPGK